MMTLANTLGLSCLPSRKRVFTQALPEEMCCVGRPQLRDGAFQFNGYFATYMSVIICALKKEADTEIALLSN